MIVPLSMGNEKEPHVVFDRCLFYENQCSDGVFSLVISDVEMTQSRFHGNLVDVFARSSGEIFCVSDCVFGHDTRFLRSFAIAHLSTFLFPGNTPTLMFTLSGEISRTVALPYSSRLSFSAGFIRPVDFDNSADSYYPETSRTFRRSISSSNPFTPSGTLELVQPILSLNDSGRRVSVELMAGVSIACFVLGASAGALILRYWLSADPEVPAVAGAEDYSPSGSDRDVAPGFATLPTTTMQDTLAMTPEKNDADESHVAVDGDGDGLA
jgi:hypothetical protein